MSTKVKFSLSLLASAFFLWLAFRQVNWPAMWQTLHTIQIGYVALYVASLLVIQVCRARRWDVLIKPFAKVSPSVSWRISSVGNMLIMLLPLRLGEFGRPYLLKKEIGAPLTAGVGAAMVERVVDGLLVTLLFFVTTAMLEPPYVVPRALQIGAVLALGIFLAALGAICATLWARRWFAWVVQATIGRLLPSLSHRLVDMCDAFASGVQALPNVRALFEVCSWTVIYWLANGLGLYALMLAFGWSLPVSAGFVLVCVLVIGIMIPAGPGFLGTYQAALTAGLAIFGIGVTEAVAYSMLAYPLNLLVVVGFGVPYLFDRQHLTLRELVTTPAAHDAPAA